MTNSTRSGDATAVKDLYRYIWKVSARGQVILSALSIAVFLLEMAPLELQRRIVNGALRSSTQGRAVWVNGTAVEDSARDKSAWTDRNGNVWLMNGTEGTHLVRPGQSIDRNGVIEDLLPSGAVARR